MLKLDNFKKKRILVVGDIILDRFITGDVHRISPEAPVPVLKESIESFKAGGAANVAVNLAELGVKTFMCGAVGNDYYGNFSISHLVDYGISTSAVTSVAGYRTTIKTRIIAQKQQMIRVDREDPLKDQSADIIKSIKKMLDKMDAVIIADYGKGLITKKLLEYLIPAANKLGKIITVDPQTEHFMSYKKVTCLTPNHNEAAAASGMKTETDEDVKTTGLSILKKLGSKSLIITRGEKGMAVFEQGKCTLIQTQAREVFDVTGAGDTVIAVLTAALCSGMTLLESAKLANKAAAIVVGKSGTATVSQEELEK
ncbi:MAG: D-glycero-beta-D-manno-heptose-7-phosphate kinase [Elusimicrobiota bacterium]|nr:D-glycero-beta-D-manno-heptose-7-phosphate kinase [Elusimicrobiota bacterium]